MRVTFAAPAPPMIVLPPALSVTLSVPVPPEMDAWLPIRLTTRLPLEPVMVGEPEALTVALPLPATIVSWLRLANTPPFVPVSMCWPY